MRLTQCKSEQLFHNGTNFDKNLCYMGLEAQKSIE